LKTNDIVSKTVAIRTLIKERCFSAIDYRRDWSLVRVCEYIDAGVVAGVDDDNNPIVIETSDIIRVF
jgi:hypothetical protein